MKNQANLAALLGMLHSIGGLTVDEDDVVRKNEYLLRNLNTQARVKSGERYDKAEAKRQRKNAKRLAEKGVE